MLLAFAVTLPSAQASDRPVSSPQASTNLPVAVEPESTSEYAGQAGVGAYSGVLYAINGTDGSEKWSFNTGSIDFKSSGAKAY